MPDAPDLDAITSWDVEQQEGCLRNPPLANRRIGKDRLAKRREVQERQRRFLDPLHDFIGESRIDFVVVFGDVEYVVLRLT